MKPKVGAIPFLREPATNMEASPLKSLYRLRQAAAGSYKE
jgi:hypothetical protein